MNKPLSATLILGCVALLAFAFILPSNTPQTAAVGTTATPTVSFTQEEVQVREGSSAKITVKLSQPVTRTTKVTVKLTGDQGTTSRDVPALSSTRSVTFYKNSPITTKSITIRTTKTAAQGDKGFTATITKVGNTTVQGDTTRVIIKDQGSTPPVPTPPTGNNTVPPPPANNTSTATSTPPTNCAQYAGVIPGDTRKVSVQQRNFQSYAFSGAYPVSSLAQTQLQQMRGDIGFALTMGARGTGNWNRNRIPSGTALAYEFKTSEYNYPIYYTFTVTDHPDSPQGVILSSVSLCPGDFTSPALLAQKSGNDVNNLYGDGKWRNCVNYGTQVGVQFPFGVGYPGGYICNLEPNKTYYLNITAGFAGGGDKGFYTPHIGTFDGTSATAGTEMNVDFTMRPDGHSMAAGGVGDNTWTTEIIKNKSEFYSELRTMLGSWNAAFGANGPTKPHPFKVQ